MGSPSLLVSHPPPKPVHRVFASTGPNVIAPEVLSKTAKEVLTHWTYCLAPTAPSVSGGAPTIAKLGIPVPSPSKLSPATGPTIDGASALVLTMVRCSAVSGSIAGLKPEGN